jgi:D-arginine dehydrogenase
VSLSRERRHLAVLETEPSLPERLPVVWRLEDEVYVRKFGEQSLACPCDHDPWHEDAPRLESRCLEALPRKLSSLVPRLRTAAIQRAWACLRTFTEDRLPLIGFEPRVPGLAWLAGLGGFGMSTGLAAGELLSEIVLGKEQPTWCDPGRFDV